MRGTSPHPGPSHRTSRRSCSTSSRWGAPTKTTRMYSGRPSNRSLPSTWPPAASLHAPDTPERYTFDPVTDWADVTRAHIRGWLACLFARGYTHFYVNNQYRCLQQFFRWFAEDKSPQHHARHDPTALSPRSPCPCSPTTRSGRFSPPCRAATSGPAGTSRCPCSCRDTGVRLSELSGLQLRRHRRRLAAREDDRHRQGKAHPHREVQL